MIQDEDKYNNPTKCNPPPCSFGKVSKHDNLSISRLHVLLYLEFYIKCVYEYIYRFVFIPGGLNFVTRALKYFLAFSSLSSYISSSSRMSRIILSFRIRWWKRVVKIYRLIRWNDLITRMTHLDVELIATLTFFAEQAK